jgi:hypothetical protein
LRFSSWLAEAPPQIASHKIWNLYLNLEHEKGYLVEPYYLFNDMSPFEMNQIRPTTQKMQGFSKTGISFDHHGLYRLF